MSRVAPYRRSRSLDKACRIRTLQTPVSLTHRLDHLCDFVFCLLFPIPAFAHHEISFGTIILLFARRGNEFKKMYVYHYTLLSAHGSHAGFLGQYGIIFDAGSSVSRIYAKVSPCFSNAGQGTRLHIYRWLNSQIARKVANSKQLQSLPMLETKGEWTKKIHPGSS